MPTKKTKAGQQAAATELSSESAESLTLLRYGAELYDSYAAQSADQAERCCLRLQRYGDYLEHFGFSPEREERQQRPCDGSHGPLPPTAPMGAAGSSKDLGTASPCLWGTAVDTAMWGVPAAEAEEADALCARLVAESADAAGAAPTTLPSLVTWLTAAYALPTWRQTPQQCELKKARILYRWLCQHLTNIRLREPPATSASAGEPPGATGKEKLPPIGGGRSAQGPNKKKGKGPATAACAAVAEREAAAPPPPPDPIQAALDTRACSPLVAARLYQAMLAACEVRCDVVEGLMKGFSATESVPWAWNCVTLDGRQHLVDVAAAVFCGSFRELTRTGGDPAAVSPSGTGGGPSSASAPAAPAARSPSKRKDGKGASKDGAAATGAAAQGGPAASLPLLSLSQGPQWAATLAAGGGVTPRDFYFCSDPAKLIYTHLPTARDATLLRTPPGRAAWEVAPRLSHDFFAFPIRLQSHARTCRVSVRAAPFYVTVTNTRPDTTELCALVYPCTLEALPEQLGPRPPAAGGDAEGSWREAEVAPLGPQWVWHQRREATNEETFTVMVPEGGFYSLVIGARAIRADPYSCQLAAGGVQGGFTPIVRYAATVNFAPLSYSLLPRQHLSPSIVRLISPLAQQLEAGTHTFAVMPTCGNVLAVAIVATRAESGRADDLGGGLPPSGSSAPREPLANPKSPPSRRLLRFLAFNPLHAVYEGEVALRSGEGVEVWVRYGAPDRNGLTLEEKNAATVARGRAAGGELSAPPAERAAPVAPPPKGTGGTSSGKRAGSRRAVEAPSGPTPEEEECGRLARRVGDGAMFLPAFSRLEVKKIASAEAATVVQPQPTVAEERDATLRRLTGVTERLYQRATQLAMHEAAPVGAFFERDGNRFLLA